MSRYGNEMGSTGARGKKVAAMRRPLLVGALTAGVIALVASAAVAVGPIGDPSSGPSRMGGSGAANMMGGSGAANMMGGSGAANMMGGSGAANMMGGPRA